jgi:hypothetical protein
MKKTRCAAPAAVHREEESDDRVLRWQGLLRERLPAQASFTPAVSLAK